MTRHSLIVGGSTAEARVLLDALSQYIENHDIEQLREEGVDTANLTTAQHMLDRIELMISSAYMETT